MRAEGPAAWRTFHVKTILLVSLSRHDENRKTASYPHGTRETPTRSGFSHEAAMNVCVRVCVGVGWGGGDASSRTWCIARFTVKFLTGAGESRRAQSRGIFKLHIITTTVFKKFASQRIRVLRVTSGCGAGYA